MKFIKNDEVVCSSLKDTNLVQHINESYIKEELKPEVHVLSETERKNEQSVPFSSFLGQVLTEASMVSPCYIARHQRSIEENCEARPETQFRRIVEKQHRATRLKPSIFKAMNQTRTYKWPKRTFDSRKREENFKFLNWALVQNMKQCRVVLKRISEKEITLFTSVKYCKVYIRPPRTKMHRQQLKIESRE